MHWKLKLIIFTQQQKFRFLIKPEKVFFRIRGESEIDH